MTTIARLVDDAELRLGDRINAYVPSGARFVPVRMSESAKLRREISAALVARGIVKGDRVAIVADTRLEWALVDLAILSIGAVTVGIYPSSTPAQMRYILEHARCRAAFVAGTGPRGALADAGVALDFVEDLDALDAIRAEGRAASLDAELAHRRDEVQPDDVAALVYTSGTTGAPKGVVLTHRALFSASKTGVDTLGMRSDDVGVGFLPLAHALARVNFYGTLHAGTTTYFAKSLEEVADVWRIAHPTALALVPRVLEKIHARVLAAVADSPPVRQKLFARAIEIGKEHARAVADGRVGNRLRAEHALWERLVFRKLRATLGWDRLRFTLCGGAPLRRDVAEFFAAIGVVVLEGYGLSETSAATVLNLPHRRRAGTVGRPLGGVELRIAEDGEILLKGPGLFRGYERDDDATRAAFDDDGFFRTGDVGVLDNDGFLRITDRKKDLLVTAGGKNVAPQNIECALAADPRIAHAIVLGDGRPYLVALLVIDAAVTGQAARQSAAAEAVARANAELARYEQVKRWALIDEEPTVASGLLTPTQKLRRRAVAERYAGLVDSLYAQEARTA